MVVKEGQSRGSADYNALSLLYTQFMIIGGLLAVESRTVKMITSQYKTLYTTAMRR